MDLDTAGKNNTKSEKNCVLQRKVTKIHTKAGKDSNKYFFADLIIFFAYFLQNFVPLL